MHESGDLIPEKVIEQNDCRTYDKRAVEVLIFDGVPDSTKESFSKDCKIDYVNPVPIVRSYNGRIDDVLGYATLYEEGKSLYADLFIQYDSPERLVLETGGKLYPSVTGVVMARDNVCYTHILVKAIMVTLTKNADERIGPI